MVRLSEARLAQLQARGRIRGDAVSDLPKPSKHRNKKSELDGIIFDSKKEAARYQELKLLERAGEIADLQLQVVFDLAPAVVLDGRKKPAIRYLSDFTYLEGGIQVVEDVKSDATRMHPVYRIKKHLMKAVHGIDIRET